MLNNVIFLILFVGGIIITSTVSALIVRDLGGILQPRQNRFDQPSHVAHTMQQSIQIRTWTIFVLVIIVISIGAMLIKNNCISLHPDSIGSGGVPIHEMPYTTVMNLKLKIEDTLYQPNNPLSKQTKTDLIKLDTALESYLNNYPSKTYKDWDTVQALITYMEETEEKIPELNKQFPEYTSAKDTLMSYAVTNAPYIPEEDFPIPVKLPIWVTWRTWFNQPVWEWLALWVLGVGSACFFAIVFARKSAQTVITAKQNANSVAAHKEALKTAVTHQLRIHQTNSYQNHLLFTRCDPRHINNGYFFTVQYLNCPHTQPLQGNERPIACLIFTVDQTGKIEEPIFEATIQYRYQDIEDQATQELSELAYASLVRKLNRNLNDKELDDLCYEMKAPPDVTRGFSHEEKTTRIITWLLHHNKICKLIEWLQHLRPQENWLGS
jgi:hypothetical protein